MPKSEVKVYKEKRNKYQKKGAGMKRFSILLFILLVVCLFLSSLVFAEKIEDCSNNKDDDGDKYIDCMDSDCIGKTCKYSGSSCTNPKSCIDGICCIEKSCTDLEDNDGDGKIDCEDSDCNTFSSCQSPPSKKGSGINNQGDGSVTDKACASNEIGCNNECMKPFPADLNKDCCVDEKDEKSVNDLISMAILASVSNPKLLGIAVVSVNTALWGYFNDYNKCLNKPIPQNTGSPGGVKPQPASQKDVELPSKLIPERSK